MALVVDSGALYALYDADDAHHVAVTRAIKEHTDLLLLPVAILAEVDYLLREFLGVEAELAFVDGLSSGAFTLEPFTGADLTRCRELIWTYRDLDLGLADAAVVAAAERLGLRKILTVDRRHFRAVRTKHGRPFVLLPFDEA